MKRMTRWFDRLLESLFPEGAHYKATPTVDPTVEVRIADLKDQLLFANRRIATLERIAILHRSGLLDANDRLIVLEKCQLTNASAPVSLN